MEQCEETLSDLSELTELEENDDDFHDAADTSFTPDQHALRASLDDPPRTYAQAMACPDALEWKLACAAELEVFIIAGLYDEVPKPKDRTLFGCRWVFAI